MIDHHMDDTRRQLGEIGAMAQQTEAMERRILSIAEEKLVDVEQKINDLRSTALQTPGSPTSQKYMEAVEERGRLQQVIARSREVLNPA